MIPFADMLNHEMVNCTYDCRDKEKEEYIYTAKELKAIKRNKLRDDQKQFLEDINKDIDKLKQEMQKKSEEAIKNVDDKPRAEEAKKETTPKQEEEEVYSSGLESDREFDLLAEQDWLHAMKMRKQNKNEPKSEDKERKKPESENSSSSSSEDSDVHDTDDIETKRRKANASYERLFRDVPDEYDFVISSDVDEYAKFQLLTVCI